MSTFKKYFPFDIPRDNQLEIAEEIIHAFKKHRYVILNAPTGVGKSAIAMTAAQYFTKNRIKTGMVSIVTSEKILQDQYTDDFAHLPDIVSVKGMGAYICPKDGDSVSEAECRVPGINCEESCEYRQMLRKRKKSLIWITNYSIALTNRTFQERTHDLFVCDEMHKIEPILLGHVTVSLGSEFIHGINKRLEKIFNVSFPESIIKLLELYTKGKEKNNENAIRFYYELFEEVYIIYLQISESITFFIKDNFSHITTKKEYTQEEIEDIKKVKYCLRTLSIIESNILVKYGLMLNHADNSDMKWILEILENEILFKPVYANFLFEPLLGRLSNKFLFMSATSYCKEMFCEQFDVSEDDVYEISLDSPFPIENRKIYVAECMSMSYTQLQKNLKSMVDTVDNLLKSISCRAVIHSGNYNIARYIASNSIHKDRIVAPKSGERELLIQRDFKNKENGILISPSIIEGVSFNDEMCRIQIVVKVPYTSLADKRIKIRATQDPLWYRQEAIFKIVQSSGRGVRHKDDFCITFILDSSFSNLYDNSSFLFPKWFVSAIEYIEPYEIKSKLRTFLDGKKI